MQSLNFFIYTYVTNYHLALAALLAGLVFGWIYTRSRTRKVASIILCVLLTTFIGYPIFSLNGYINERKWRDAQALEVAKKQANTVWMVQQCKEHTDYILVRNTCYKPYSGYVPLTTWTINEKVGNAVASTDGK